MIASFDIDAYSLPPHQAHDFMWRHGLLFTSFHISKHDMTSSALLFTDHYDEWESAFCSICQLSSKFCIANRINIYSKSGVPQYSRHRQRILGGSQFLLSIFIWPNGDHDISGR